MKILLTAINTKYIHSNLAIYSLKASAKAKGIEIDTLEYTINNLSDEILKGIYNSNCDILMFSCYIWNIELVEKLSTEFHKLRPSVPIWVGGPEVSYDAVEFLKRAPQITGVMIGEGEITLTEVCRTYLDFDTADIYIKLSTISGIAYRNSDNNIIVTTARDLTDMSSLPFAYNLNEDFSNRIIYYESSRGCPFSCSYCLSSIDKCLRFRNLDLVKKELKFFIDQKVPQVKFVDRTFNCNHKHSIEIWKYIKTHDNGITNFHFEISADLLNEEELEIMSDMRPGLIQLEIGVQSTNEATIKEIHRTMKLNRVKEISTRIRKFNNIHQHLDLIAGLPYEDYESFRNSFNEIYALSPNQLQLGFLKVLKGSYMHEHIQDYGILYHDTPPYEVLSTKWLSYDDVLLLKKVEEMTEVYYNSSQFEATLKYLSGLTSSPFDFFQSLGNYYEVQNYLSMSHSRLRRCEILLEFLADPSNLAFADLQKPDLTIVKEALIFDLYYRENCKTRPSWAIEMSTFKDQTRIYCKKGKLSHLEPFNYDFLGLLAEKTTTLLRLSSPLYVLFDYEKRNPLDNQALTQYMNDLSL